MRINMKNRKKHTIKDMKTSRITTTALAAIISLWAGAQSVVYGDEESNYILRRVPLSGKTEKATSVPYDNKGIERYRLSGIGDNWYVSAETGPSFFLGIPKGCGDLFDRIQPSFSVSVGKWHSPFFGTRAKWQGFRLVSASSDKTSYTLLHQDFLFNVSSFFHRDCFAEGARWNVSPYAGLGLFRNNDLDRNKLAVTYGVSLSYKVCPRVHVKGELSGLVTSRTFDGFGARGKVGDGLYTASIGIAFGIGREGWNRKHGRVVEKYVYADDTSYASRARSNDYSGLNSLRDRLSKADSAAAYFQAPVLFFFKINSTTFVDKQQTHNIDEIAHVVKTYGLKLRIIGAADSKTGSTGYNRKLSIARAKYIAKCFLRRGVSKSQMSGASLGGVNIYKPYPANRHTCVIVYQGDFNQSKYEYGE